MKSKAIVIRLTDELFEALANRKKLTGVPTVVFVTRTITAALGAEEA